MVKTSSVAIINNEDYGPIFGSGTNIVIAKDGDDSTAKLGSSYPAPPGVQDTRTILAGQEKFNPDKVEVFFLG